MIIKKHKNRNDYINTSDGVWVRNFAKTGVSPIDINNFLSEEDYRYVLNNEFKNRKVRFSDLLQKDKYQNAVIVSDGFDFESKQEILAKLSYKEVAIIATNGALRDWKLVGQKAVLKRAITWFVVNNPYPECKKFLPMFHSYYPRCLASSRTNTEFVDKYKGDVLLYQPPINEHYSGCFHGGDGIIDDYRNPICAAIGLVYRLGIQRLLLLCCDDSFSTEKPAAEQLENGLWCYPQQKISQRIIDANLYWLTQSGVQIADCSSGVKYENATYISVEEIPDFFKGNEDDKQIFTR